MFLQFEYPMKKLWKLQGLRVYKIKITFSCGCIHLEYIKTISVMSNFSRRRIFFLGWSKTFKKIRRKTTAKWIKKQKVKITAWNVIYTFVRRWTCASLLPHPQHYSYVSECREQSLLQQKVISGIKCGTCCWRQMFPLNCTFTHPKLPPAHSRWAHSTVNNPSRFGYCMMVTRYPFSLAEMLPTVTRTESFRKNRNHTKNFLMLSALIHYTCFYIGYKDQIKDGIL